MDAILHQRTAEIQQQTALQFRDAKICEHLRLEDAVKCGNALDLDDNLIIYNEIRDELAKNLAAVSHRKTRLADVSKARDIKFDFEAAMIDVFPQTRADTAMQGNGACDDSFCRSIV